MDTMTFKEKIKGVLSGTQPPKGNHISIIIIVGLAVAMIMAASGLITLLQSYQTAMLESQKNQLINISESVSNNISLYLGNYQRSSEVLLNLDGFHDALSDFMKGDDRALVRFLEQVHRGRAEEITCLIYESPDGRVCEVGETETFTPHKELGSDDSFQMLRIDKDEKGNFYFRISATPVEGGRLYLYLPLITLYNRTAATIHMGEDGYVMVKDSDGIILMHPVDQQIGLDVLEDRRTLYPTFDFSELEVLIEHQLAGESGVETYHSYWWADNPPTSVRKVSAYLPLHLGDDFLSISAVMNYSDIAEPVQSVGIRILMVTILLVVSLLGFFLILIQTLSRQQRIELENDQLKKINEHLEQLRQQEEALAQQQRLQLIGTMTSGIAHEFNNCLTPIMGYSAMILSGTDEDDENYADLKEIYTSAERAKEIIDQLTQFSRKNAEKMFEPIHIGEAVKKALKITDAAKPRHIEMDVHLDTTKDVCMGNPIQIYQMVVNLCNNAIQAMGDAPGTLTVVGRPMQPKDNKDAFFRGKEDKWFYRLSFSDTGCGMDEETMNQIFVPFFTTKKPGEGTGLGLSIVQRLVESHKGYICVHSAQASGAEFVIYLPLEETDDGAVEPLPMETEV